MNTKIAITITALTFTASTTSFADETVNGKLTVTGSLELLSGYEKLYWGSNHTGTTDHRNYLAPIKADGSGFDWNQEFGYHHYHRAWYFEGDVGIGIHSPTAKLDVYLNGSTTWNPIAEFAASTNGRLLVSGYALGSDNDRVGLVWENQNVVNMRMWMGDDHYLYSSSGDPTGSTDGRRFIQEDGNGNVGIGTPNSDGHKLAVNGTVRAKEVIVDTGWSDFVFEDSYQLRSLEAVESHIDEYGHLPDVPSATIIESEGLSVGEAQKIMMQKIEELTLYMIEKDKQIAELKAEVEKLKSN